MRGVPFTRWQEGRWESHRIREKSGSSLVHLPEEIILYQKHNRRTKSCLNAMDLKKDDVSLQQTVSIIQILFLAVQAHKRGIKHIIVHSNPDNTSIWIHFRGYLKRTRMCGLWAWYTPPTWRLYHPRKRNNKNCHDNDALVILTAPRAHLTRCWCKALDVILCAFSGIRCRSTGMGVLYGKHHLLEELETLYRWGGHCQRHNV